MLGRKATDAGKAEVYLDGVRQVPDIDLYTFHDPVEDEPIYTKTGLTSAAHNVTIIPLGTKQAASTNTWIYVDAFTVGATTYEETNAAVKFQFRRVEPPRARTPGRTTRRTSTTTGDTDNLPYYKLTFRGTDVLVYATKTASSGKADFYIDGVLKANDVDLYTAATTYKVKVFDSVPLADGVHILTVKVTGLKRTAATGTDVALDYVTLQ